MKIVLLNDDALPTGKGGTAVVVERLRKEYVKQGHTVTLITTHQSGPKDVQYKMDTHGEIISIYRNYDLTKRHRNCLFDQYMHDTLTTLLTNIQPDAVHAHNVHTYLTYDSLCVARTFTTQVVLTAHDVMLVAFHRVNSKKYLTSVLENKPYKMHVIDHLLSVGRKYWPLRNSQIRKILQKSETKVVAVSTALKKFLETNSIPVEAVIYNGIDTASIVTTEVTQSTKSIVFAGRANIDKGIAELIHAFEQVIATVDTARLVMIGNITAAELAPYCSNPSTLKHIECTGWLDQTSIQEKIQNADVVTTPSICLDTFNLVNIEAMHAQKPVVGTCFGGTPEIVIHNETGFIVDPRNTKLYSSYLLELLQDTSKASAFGKTGKERVKKYFSITKQAEDYLTLLA